MLVRCLCLAKVGFMVQTYPHKLPEVDFEVFEQIVNSLLFCSQQVKEVTVVAPSDDRRGRSRGHGFETRER